MQYLVFIYIANCRYFVKCFIDKILHFEIIFTSREEDEHVVLKRQLRSLFDNLKTVIDENNFLLIKKLNNYRLKLKNNKIGFFLRLHNFIFDQISAHVSRHAIKKIETQYHLLIQQSTILLQCINVFIIIIDLSCSHQIQQRLFQSENVLIKNVHSH